MKLIKIKLARECNSKVKAKAGFSLTELMFSSAILLIIILGLLYTYVVCAELNEFSKNLTLVNNALQAELEYIRETPFDNLSALDGQTFTLDGFSDGSAIGVIDVYDSVYGDLKYIRIVACWRQKSQRVIGEDRNLDGVLQESEDVGDIEDVLESPAEISTLISKID